MLRSFNILSVIVLLSLLFIFSITVNAQDSNPPANPTPTPEGRSPEIQRFSSDSVLQTGDQGRGIDRASFSATFFDNADLRNPLFTRPYMEPLAFELQCFSQPYPYFGCKLIPELTEGGNWSVRWTGILVVPQTGEYTFILAGHDDGVRVLIGGEEIVDSGWRYPSPDIRPSPQTVTLEAGYAELVVEFEQRVPFAAVLDVRWSGPGFSQEVIPFTNADVAKISSVEFTQATQELQSLQELKDDLASDGEPPIPMIALKRGVIRVYFEDVPTAVDIGVQVRVLGQSMQTKQVSLVPGCSVEQQRLHANGCTSADFYFVAPEGSWSATVLTINENGVPVESHDFSLTSRTVNSMKQVPVSVCDLKLLQSEECESGDELKSYINLLRLIAPTHYVQIVGPSRELRILEGPLSFMWWPDLILQMHSLWVADGFPDRYYHGMVPESAPGSMGGMSIGKAAATRVYINNFEFTTFTVAHESGHLLGRKHTNTEIPNPPCRLPDIPRDSNWEYLDNRIQEVGFNVATRQPVPPETNYDVMSYCPPPVWTSPYTYLGMLDHLDTSPVTVSFQTATYTFWQISGRMDTAGEIERLAPVFTFEAEGQLGSGEGSYRIDVLDGDGAILFTRYFDPISSVELVDGEPLQTTVFSELIPLLPAAAHFRIENPGGNVLITVDLNGIPPSVLLSGLPEDVPLVGEYKLEWEIIDGDSDEHTARVEYLPDGVTRYVLSWDTNERSLRIDFDKLPSCSESCLIRVLVSDGVNTGIGEIFDFTVPSKSPTVEVIFPAEGEIYKYGDMVWFQAVAQDPDDGYLYGSNVRWSSNIDGVLGVGEEFSTQGLTEGVHLITVTATDSEGNTATDEISVRVDGTDPELGLDVQLGNLPVMCPLVTLNASDEASGSGLSAIEYSLDRGLSWIAVSFDQLPLQFTPTGFGPVHIVARAIDLAGNLSAADRRFYIDQECQQGNQPPHASANGPYSGVEGAVIQFDGSASSDPDGDSLEFRWDYQSDGIFDTPFSLTPTAEFTYPDDFEGNVTLQVRDREGLLDTDMAAVDIVNAPPILSADDVSINEGQEAEITVSIEDPGVDDTHSATVQWLDPQSIFNDPESVPIVGDHGSGVINFSKEFSDNGVFSARISVQDDDGAESTLDVVVEVSNLEPDVTLDLDEAVSLSIGEVFIGRAGAEQSHQAVAVDPGSDDLLFVWEYSNGSRQMTYYNNGIGPDPEFSQGGIYPFQASDTASIEFFSPGFYDIMLEVIDDDGGDSVVGFSKLITGNEMCTRSQGFWKHQFSGKGKPHFDDDILLRYLDLVDKASGYFGEVIPVDDIGFADSVMNPKGPDKRKKAEAQLLAAWLNFVNGGVDWNETIQLDDGKMLSLGEALWRAESILNDVNSTDAQYLEALKIAETINLLDEGKSSCK